MTQYNYTEKLTWGERYALVGRVSILDVRESDNILRILDLLFFNEKLIICSVLNGLNY